MSNIDRKHVAIVGGGLAGLAAATYLGRKGHRVTLFERSESLGGRAATIERDGFLHNMGPHALYQGGAGVEVLEELGIDYSGHSPDLSGVAVRKGRTYTLPTSGRSMVATRLFGMRARVEAGRQMLALRKLQAGESRSVRQWLDQEFREPASRDYMEALVRLATYANAPGEIPLVDAARQLTGASGGVVYLDGGWKTLIDSLERTAVSLGAEIRTGQRVEGVEHDSRAVSGLRIDGIMVRADAVLLAVAPSVASHLAPSASSLGRVEDAALPARAACLDVGLSRLPIARRVFGLGIDQPYYFSVHSRWAQLAPEGKVLASVAKYLPAGEPHDATRILAELEGFMDMIQPGWREFEERRQFLPNMTVTTALPRIGTGGIAGRPSPAVSELENLYIAGDWVAGGGWLTDATLGSARDAAKLIEQSFATKGSPALASVS